MSTDLQREHIGERIRYVRSARGWSQSHLAELAGMKKAQLSRYEVGASTPRSEVIHRIATALGVAPGWLKDGEGIINDDEAIEGEGKVVPISPEAMGALIELSTELGCSITKAIEVALKGAVEEMRKKTQPPEEGDS